MITPKSSRFFSFARTCGDPYLSHLNFSNYSPFPWEFGQRLTSPSGSQPPVDIENWKERYHLLYNMEKKRQIFDFCFWINIQHTDIILLPLCVCCGGGSRGCCLNVCLHHVHSWSPWWQQEGVWSNGTRIVDNGEQLCEC